MLAAAAAVVSLLSGCATVRNAATPSPICSTRQNDVLVLMAQSVPSADRVPCIATYPAGWNLAGVGIRSGQASFTLDSDRGGTGALKVTLDASCDISGATQVPSDAIDTVRYERVLSVDAGFRAVRSYRFAGGCVTYQFRFRQRGQALVNEASLVIGFVTRAEIDRRVRAESHGRVHL